MRAATSRPPSPNASAMPSATAPSSEAYVIVTIVSAIWSWSKIMKPATAMIKIGTTVAITFPVVVSPVVRERP